MAITNSMPFMSGIEATLFISSNSGIPYKITLFLIDMERDNTPDGWVVGLPSYFKTVNNDANTKGLNPTLDPKKVSKIASKTGRHMGSVSPQQTTSNEVKLYGSIMRYDGVAYRGGSRPDVIYKVGCVIQSMAPETAIVGMNMVLTVKTVGRSEKKEEE